MVPPLRIFIVALFISTWLTSRQVAQDTGRSVAFRSTPVEVQTEQTASGPTTKPEPAETRGLPEEQERLEREIAYARKKLEAARRRALSLSVGASPEQRERAEQEAQDWAARVKSMEEDLASLAPDANIPPGTPTGATPENAPILPGENLEIFVVEDSSFNGRYQVRRGGYIILPQLGRIYVAGKPINQAEATVKKALESSQLRSATVMIERLEGVDVETGPVVYLAGEFRHPRPYKIPAGTAPTLVSVIIGSGGVTDRADLTCVKVMRVAALKGVVEEVNVQKILEGGGLTSDVRLNDGDVITVPATSANVVYVTGNVKKQGSFQLKSGENLTAYACILQSGGFARFANLKKVHILRAMPDGTKTKIPVNIVAIKKGQQADVPLVGNDIIVVPEKFFSF